MSLVLASLIFTFLQDDQVRQEYEERRLSAPQNAKGQCDLGKWCEKNKLKEEAIKAYERAVEIDPDCEPARKALGHKKVLGRWATEKNYADTSWWAHPKVDQKKVDDAIVKGCEFLLNRSMRELPVISLGAHGKFRTDELVLLTLIQAGWDQKDRRFSNLLYRVLAYPPEHTYNVSIKAMCLAELDPLKYQQQLAVCAQFLVDNQCANGQWSYGHPVKMLPPPGSFPTTKKGPIPDIETGVQGDSDPGKKAPQPGQIEIKKGQSVGGRTGDHSNSQYAALGLRACLSGLVVAPKETIQAAHDWWEKNQQTDGGWGYGSNAPDADVNKSNYGSMSAGGLGALVIYKYYLKRVWNENQDFKAAPSIVKGIGWMGANVTFTENPKFPRMNAWHHYWIYAIERAGRLVETEKFGTHEWYVEGADWLLPRQQPDGSWQQESWYKAGGNDSKVAESAKANIHPEAVLETCFAIMFLRRATPKLDDTIKIASGDAKEGKVIRQEK